MAERRENPELTPERFAKLPKWARDHIGMITRERDVAIDRLDQLIDDQTESKCYSDVMDSTGEQRGPKVRRVYFQAKESITIVNAGVKLTVDFYSKDHIFLSWGVPGHGLRDVAMIPNTYQQVKLVAQEHLS